MIILLVSIVFIQINNVYSIDKMTAVHIVHVVFYCIIHILLFAIYLGSSYRNYRTNLSLIIVYTQIHCSKNSMPYIIPVSVYVHTYRVWR